MSNETHRHLNALLPDQSPDEPDDLSFVWHAHEHNGCGFNRLHHHPPEEHSQYSAADLAGFARPAPTDPPQIDRDEA